MKRLAAVVLAAVFALGPVPSAQASADDRFGLTVDKRAVFSGERLTATATAASGIVCDWALTWNGETHAVSGNRVLVATFRAPRVTRPTRLPLRGVCFYAPPAGERAAAKAAAGRGSRSSQQILVTIPPSWRSTVTITVVPGGNGVSPPESPQPGTGGAGNLPNAGGPQRWLLLLGLGSVLAGAVGVRAARARRG